MPDFIDQREQFLANHFEGAMQALDSAEQSIVNQLDELYGQQLGDDLGPVLIQLREFMEAEYAREPARTRDGRTLPLTYRANIAQEPYYRHEVHTAWRFLFCRANNYGGRYPTNPWIHPRADYVHRDFLTGNATYGIIPNDSLRLIALLWLAANDQQRTSDVTAAKNLVANCLAVCGRSHNWDNTRVVRRGIAFRNEYYDDMGPDRPTCSSGIDHRMLRALIHHPLNERPENRELDIQLVKQRFVENWLRRNVNQRHNIYGNIYLKSFQEIFALKKVLKDYNGYYQPCAADLSEEEQNESVVARTNLEDNLSIITKERAVFRDMRRWWGYERISAQLESPLTLATDRFDSYEELIRALIHNPFRYCHDEYIGLFDMLLQRKQRSFIHDVVNEFNAADTNDLSEFLNAYRINEEPLDDALKQTIIERHRDNDLAVDPEDDEEFNAIDAGQSTVNGEFDDESGNAEEAEQRMARTRTIQRRMASLERDLNIDRRLVERSRSGVKWAGIALLVVASLSAVTFIPVVGAYMEATKWAGVLWDLMTVPFVGAAGTLSCAAVADYYWPSTRARVDRRISENTRQLREARNELAEIRQGDEHTVEPAMGSPRRSFTPGLNRNRNGVRFDDFLLQRDSARMTTTFLRSPSFFS